MFLRGLLALFLSLIALAPHKGHAHSLIDFESIFFELDQSSVTASLNSSQISVLEEMAGILKRNPKLRILVAGDADISEGSDSQCQAISEHRAKLVYDWLTDHGVSSQLKGYKGFGNARPVDFTETEEQRRRNRRVEFAVDYEGLFHK